MKITILQNTKYICLYLYVPELYFPEKNMLPAVNMQMKIIILQSVKLAISLFKSKYYVCLPEDQDSH